MPVAETTQPYTAYAGPSNPQYNQVQQPYTYPQSSTYQTTPHQPSYNQQLYPQPAHPQPVRPSVEGRTVQGSWDPYRPTETLSYEELDNCELPWPPNGHPTLLMMLSILCTTKILLQGR
jgi:hypothetical protein